MNRASTEFLAPGFERYDRYSNTLTHIPLDEMIWDYSGPGKILHERQAPPPIWSGRPQGAASRPTSQEPLHLRTSCVPIACWTDFREETHPWMRPAVLTAQHRRQLLYPQRGWQGQGRKEPGPLPSDGSHRGHPAKGPWCHTAGVLPEWKPDGHTGQPVFCPWAPHCCSARTAEPP